jgi:hypothetical protein
MALLCPFKNSYLFTKPETNDFIVKKTAFSKNLYDFYPFIADIKNRLLLL